MMCSERGTRSRDLAQRIGERGDLLACVTGEIAADLSGADGVGVTEDQLMRLRRGLDDLEELADQLEVLIQSEESVASAD